MHTNTTDIAVHDFAPGTETMRNDVWRSLSRAPKELPGQYLYDQRGAQLSSGGQTRPPVAGFNLPGDTQLFERICETEEYYLTRTELGILRCNMDAIAARVGPCALVIEPGIRRPSEPTPTR